MEKVCLFDINNTGHHWIYNNLLMNGINEEYDILYFTSNLKENEKLQLEKNNINYKEIIKDRNNNKIIKNIEYFILMIKMLFIMKKEKSNKLVVLYLDDFIYQVALLQYIFSAVNIDLILTLHWYRDENKKELFLKKILKNKRNKVIVHTNYNRKKLQNIYNEGLVEVIKYPMDNIAETLDEGIKKNNRDNLMKVLYYGATRFDKGVDILLESLQYCKTPIELTIAGGIGQVSEEFIKEKANKFKQHKFILNLKYISDEETDLYFKSTDVVVLPYRKHFNGESGVFIQALTYGVPVIIPDIIHFPDEINKYKNGVVFKCEDREDLARKIEFVNSNLEYYKENAMKNRNYFRKIYSSEVFIESYKVILEG